MKKIATLASISFGLLILCTPVLAVDTTGPIGPPTVAKPEIKQEAVDATTAAKPPIKDRIVLITGAIVTATSTNSLTISKDSKSLTVNILPTTRLRRKFWGNSTTAEIVASDKVNVWGVWAADSESVIDAQLVRDLSVQKRNGVFVGTVTSLTSTGWLMNTFNRGPQTVSVSAGIKFTDRSGKAVSQADIAVGNFVRVRGLWDSKANMISEPTTVKDYSLPLPKTTTVSTGSAVTQ